MALTNKNIPVLDRKEFQMMTPAPVATVAAAFVVAPGSGYSDLAMYVTSATVAYLYSHAEDGFTQIPSPALAGVFGAGACGAYSSWSITVTATGGTTTTVTVAAASFNLTAACIGSTIEFLSAGTATGQRRRITGIDNQGGAGTITLTLDYAVATAVLNTHTFRLSTGRIFLMSAGTTAAGSWKVFDVATMTWQASLGTTNLPASWATDGKAVWTGRPPSVLANGAATSGSTTTLIDSAQNWAVNAWAGMWVLLVSGTGVGQIVKIVSNTATTLTFAAITTAPAAATVYQIRGNGALAVGVATSGSATTVVNSGKAWTVNQWTNYQCRIIAGTGAGQIRKITSNTATTLTIVTGATIDSTSVYEIEPNEDSIYLLGNNAVTMYLYSISGNTWSVVAPTTARAAAPNAGMCADFIGVSNDPLWANENVIQDGRYIISVRAANGTAIDRFDIAGGTAGAGAWLALTYPGATEVFNIGSSAFQAGRFLYIRKDATNRFVKFDLVGNVMLPFTTDLYPDGVALAGQKVWVKNFDQTEQIQWLYSLANTGTVLRRVGIV